MRSVSRKEGELAVVTTMSMRGQRAKHALTFGDFTSAVHGFVHDICAFLEVCSVALLGLWAVI